MMRAAARSFSLAPRSLPSSDVNGSHDMHQTSVDDAIDQGPDLALGGLAVDTIGLRDGIAKLGERRAGLCLVPDDGAGLVQREIFLALHVEQSHAVAEGAGHDIAAADVEGFTIAHADEDPQKKMRRSFSAASALTRRIRRCGRRSAYGPDSCRR